MYVKERFELANVSDIRSTPILWGYGQFSQVTYYNNYSRLKYMDDVPYDQEHWHDTVIRVIEGTFSIRKDWYVRNRIRWDEGFWQDYATKMAISLTRMEWLPPGRGLWAMGTDLVYERGAMPLYNCFSGDTKFYTSDGVKALIECVDCDITVMCPDGKYRPATVKKFGRQKLNLVSFKNSVGKTNKRHLFKATSNHRWVLSDGTETTHLKKGDRVIIKDYNPRINNHREFADGFAHGFVFGDGSKCSNVEQYQLPLHGEKDRKYLQELATASTFRRIYDSIQDPIVYFDAEEDYKSLPVDQSVDYYHGFLTGWIAADGTRQNNRTICLDTIDKEAADWVHDWSYLFGLIVVGHTVWDGETSYGKYTSPLQKIKLRDSGDQELTVEYIIPQEEDDVYCVVQLETQDFVLVGGVPTGNCNFTEITYNWVDDLCWLMDSLMNGCGVGFGPKRIHLHLEEPTRTHRFTIPDTREGWVESVRQLLWAFHVGGSLPVFDYSAIRKKGELIKTFGGIASGPDPLIRLHNWMVDTCYEYMESHYDVVKFFTDMANQIGVCIITGNVRRGAEIAVCGIDDPIFMQLKDYEKFPERAPYGWMSNNSVALSKNRHFERMDEIAMANIRGHDVGYVNLRNYRYGRVGKHDDFARFQLQYDKAVGINPCGEIPLEHREVCNVAESLPTRCVDSAKWFQAAMYATTYCSTVSLLPTHQPSTNAVVNRNRRIGVSIIDFTGWIENEGVAAVTRYLRKGYEIVRRVNKELAHEAGVPPSNRVTTVKPGGTTPKLAGKTSGAGYPTFKYTLRRINVRKDTPMAAKLMAAGVPFEESYYTPETTWIFEFPIVQGPARPATEVTLWQQALNVMLLQREWADNAVSNTLYFKPKWRAVAKLDPNEFPDKEDTDFRIINGVLFEFDPNHEEDQLEDVLSYIAPHTKSISLLPHSSVGIYKQMPEEGITKEEYERRVAQIQTIDWSDYFGSDGQDERFCQGDHCELIS